METKNSEPIVEHGIVTTDLECLEAVKTTKSLVYVKESTVDHHTDNFVNNDFEPSSLQVKNSVRLVEISETACGNIQPDTSCELSGTTTGENLLEFNPIEGSKCAAEIEIPLIYQTGQHEYSSRNGAATTTVNRVVDTVNESIHILQESTSRNLSVNIVEASTLNIEDFETSVQCYEPSSKRKRRRPQKLIYFSEEKRMKTSNKRKGQRVKRLAKTQSWECSYCDAFFKTKVHRDKHFKQAHQFQCNSCDQVFLSKTDFEFHVSSVHGSLNGNSVPKCSSFSESSVSINEGTGYVCSMNKGKELQDKIHGKYSCWKCGKMFLVKKKLTRHLHCHSEQKKFSCENCGKAFKEKGSLSKHYETHYHQNIPCEMCGKQYKSNRTLLKHMQTHKNSNHNCEICGKNYRTQIGLESHMTTHRPGPSQYTCSVCQHDCRTKHYLSVHMKQRHQNGSFSVFTCPECGKEFKWELSLKNHLFVKHGKGKGKGVIECDICQKKFVNKYNLLAHLPHHNELRPYKCEHCAVCFKYKHSYEKHLEVVHSDKKEHQCSVCGKLFKTKAYLNAHETNVHHSGAKEVCRICNKNFKTAKILRAHLKCHSDGGKRKFICSSCPRGFAFPKDLRRHEKVHTGVKDYECDECGKAFARMDNLRTHLKLHKQAET
ncbi:gastrula zinc finger protein XlCGF57.1-like [Limulus polyphemus]|uniref:Gastrula zinc finger protein XlCGF57.1-like n=1 Tax=Limulus polyphemus TaxID=6850 RepID=A0ABM1BV99_LIMPO|nr:gastrula zinc finger protein XlCGF57.1-like [Limulus polyphemus]